MDIIRRVTPEQKETVKTVPDFLDDYEDDFETYDSIQQATDTTHIDVTNKMIEQRQQVMFDMKTDAREQVEKYNQYQADEEYKQLKNNFGHVKSYTDGEKKAIISNIIHISPKIVFEAIAEYHSMIDKKAVITGKVESSREEMHKQKYDTLLADLIADKNIIEEHIMEFKDYLGV